MFNRNMFTAIIKIPEIILVDMIFWGHAEHLFMYNNVWGNLAPTS